MSKRYNEKELRIRIEKAMENCLTMAGVAQCLGINYKTLKHYAIKFGLFKPNPSGKGCYDKTIEDFLNEKITIGKSILKKRLIDEGYLKYICSECGIDSWCNKILTLELDHVDGNKKNNKLENLRLLCPNCHSQTITYRNKKNVTISKEIIEKEIKNCNSQSQLCKRLGISNRGKETRIRLEKLLSYEIVFETINIPIIKNKIDIKKTKKVKIEKKCSCGKKIKKESFTCYQCYAKSMRTVKRPSHTVLLKEIKQIGYSAVGRKYGVSDNAIRKWIKNNKK